MKSKTLARILLDGPVFATAGVFPPRRVRRRQPPRRQRRRLAGGVERRPHDGRGVIDVLANDDDVDGDDLTAKVTVQPEHGRASTPAPAPPP